jgi:hypothetical protein
MSINMNATIEQELDQLEKDSEWLHNHYNDIVGRFSEEFVAIKNQHIIAHHRNLDNFKKELEDKNVNPSEILIEYIRDKRDSIY